MNVLAFTTEPNQQNATAHIRLEGDLSIRNAAELREKLREAVHHYSGIRLSVCNVAAMDLSALQLLFSAQTGMEKAGKKLELQLDLQDDMKDLLYKSGFMELLKTHQ